MNFLAPTRRLLLKRDMRSFERSRAFARYITLVQALNSTARGAQLAEDCFVSPLIQRLLDALASVEIWIGQHPPKPHHFRYGNSAFREWVKRLQASVIGLLYQLLPRVNQVVLIELSPYFCESFGNFARIDYGTGHESSFIAFLLCLNELGLVSEEDYRAVVLRVFPKYISLTRKLQTTYWLEPAGTRGVWGLDDYCFLPFLWGSSQLILHKSIRPESIHDDVILKNFRHEYMYLSSILFIKKVKHGSIHETSPLLNDISSVMNWDKVNSGLLKMYKVECLGKFPVMQHFLFGSILSIGPFS